HAVLSASRPRGEALVELRDVKIGPASGDKITVVEAVNDNMPFLLDSTLAEIAELGLSLRLVAHPILNVDRDASGSFVALRGEARAHRRAGERRESFILLALHPIQDVPPR